MVTTSNRTGSPRHAAALRRWLAPVMLFVVATLTVLLWMRAVPAAIGSAGNLNAGDQFTATVSGCDAEGICTVAWDAADGRHERVFDEPGMFAPSPGFQVTVAERDGRIVQAGWPALAEGALLLFIAVSFTGFTLSWWRRVLDSAPLMPEDFDRRPPAGPAGGSVPGQLRTGHLPRGTGSAAS